MTRLALRIAQPIMLWALHFALVYALISAACGPRALIDPPLLRVVVSLVTLLPAVIGVILLISAGRHCRRAGPETTEAVLASAAYWATAISVLAILINVTPVAMLGSCSG